ncbi:unnamed protein product [Spirodela intermedia]|uniref:NAB domain-containing protein n=1 Tax=Spirodela intermedia TaxID=51605 RepID=A0A7I8KAW4_SPIIN|nr:unnamed protein product [Spirodela intermedia]
MAKTMNANPRRMYSWWWDSHISPKNSKWLQENLKDMDIKVSLMIRLLEEDGDSFARKAEMYYKKRPELMKLVEEFYRAYRALAERYDHATGALRQAHRTIQEAFPNQIPSTPTDDPPSGTSATADSDPHTPEIDPSIRAFIEGDIAQKETSDGEHPYLHAIKRNGTCSEENDRASGRRGLKQLNDIFTQGKARKGLNFHEEEGEGRSGSAFFQPKEVGGRDGVEYSQLSSEKEMEEMPRLRESLSKSESDREAALLECQKFSEKLSNLELEISRAREENGKLNSEMGVRLESSEGRCLLLEREKEALKEKVNALNQQINDRGRDLEQKKEELEELKRSLQEEVNQSLEKLKDAELSNRSLAEDLQNVKELNANLSKELRSKQEELEKLASSVQEESLLKVRAEEALQSVEKLNSRSQEEMKVLFLDLQSKAEMLNDVESRRRHLEEELEQHKDENGSLKAQILSSASVIKNLREEISTLEETQVRLDNEVHEHTKGKAALQQDVRLLRDEITDLDMKLRCVIEQIEAVGLSEESFQVSVGELQSRHRELRERCETYEDEKAVLLGHVEEATEKSVLLEKSLSETMAELEGLKAMARSLEDSCESLNKRMAELTAENGSLARQLEATTQNMEKLSEKNTLLESSFSDANGVIEGLREQMLGRNMEVKELHESHECEKLVLLGHIEKATEKTVFLEKSLSETSVGLEGVKAKARSLEESNESLNRKIAELVTENGSLSHLLEASTQSMEKVSENNSLLEKSLSNANGEIEGLREKLQSVHLELERLRETSKDENAVFLGHIEKATEKRTLLEKSLSEATAELEGLKVNARSLEESCESLNRRMIELTVENGSLALQLEAGTHNMGKLLEKNASLESSFSDAHSEIEGLREKLKGLEESLQSLYEENSNLQSEKNSLTSQVENACASAEKLTKSYVDLEEKHLHVEREKESTLLQVNELQTSLKLKGEEHEAFVSSSDTQLATLAGNLNLSQQECQLKEEELERLREEILDSEIKGFIFQWHLLDAEERFQALLALSASVERSLSDMGRENFEQEKVIKSLSEHNKNLQGGIEGVLEHLGIKGSCGSDGSKDDSHCQKIVVKIKEIQKFLSDTLDENSFLVIGESVNTALLEQLGLDLMILNSEKSSLSREYRTRTGQLLALKGEKHELLQANEELTQVVSAGHLREDKLKAELDALGKKLLDLHQSHEKLQAEVHILLGENQTLGKVVSDLKGQIENLEEENSSVLVEAINLSCLSLLFKQLGAERTMDLKACSSNLDSLRRAQNALEDKMANLIQKTEVLEGENGILKGSAITLEAVHKRLNQQIETGQDILVQRDLELTEALQKIKVSEDANLKLCTDLDAIRVKLDDSLALREELEKEIRKLIDASAHKDEEMAHAQQENQTLSGELQDLRDELVVLRATIEHLSSEMTQEIRFYEEEAFRLWNDAHISTVYVQFIEEKMLELMGECESLEMCALVRQKMLEEHVILVQTHADSLEKECRTLKTKLSTYLPLVLSLQDSMACLEQEMLSVMQHRGLKGHSTQDASSVSPELVESHDHLVENPRADEANGALLGLQRLQVRVEELQKFVMKCRDSSMSEPAGNKTEEEAKGSKNTIVLPDLVGHEDSTNGNGLAIKDIQLDLPSCDRSDRKGETKSPETDDQMLRLWETAERDSNNQILKASPVVGVNDLHLVEGVKGAEESRYPSSELMSEKESGIDQMGLQRKVNSRRGWSQRILDRLASDTQRLLTLQNNTQELKTQLEKSRGGNRSTDMKYDAMMERLKRAEEAIQELVNANNDSTKKAEGPTEEGGSQWRNQVLETVQIGREKIARLELELQKIQYILLKLKEERETRAKGGRGRSRTILRDYLYGRGDGHDGRKKGGRLCGSCIQPKVVED